MKNFILAASFITLALISCKPSRDEALNYNDKIVAFQKAIDNKEVELLEAFKERDPSRIDNTYSAFKTQIATSSQELEALGTFDEKAYFIEGARTLFAQYKSVAATEYARLVEINKMADSLYTDEVQMEETKNFDAINAKLDSGLAEFTAIQERFASEYDFILEKTEENEAN